MFKKLRKKYDDPRDTHGFYENFNQHEEVSLSEVFEVIFWVFALVAPVVVLFLAFFS